MEEQCQRGYVLHPLGESAIIIRWPGGIGEDSMRLVDCTVERLAAAAPPAVTEWVRAYTSVTVCYDPWVLYREGLPGETATGESDLPPWERLCAWLHRCLQGVQEEAQRRRREELPVLRIPACFGGSAGPDLDRVAQGAGLSPEAAVELYCSADYTVHLIGFLPGFPYLGGLPPALETPRLAEPRLSVPGGSIGIAGSQTGIYPLETPGGWRLIGRTPLRLFDPERSPASLLQPGNRVRFEPVSAEMCRELEAEGRRG